MPRFSSDVLGHYAFLIALSRCSFLGSFLIFFPKEETWVPTYLIPIFFFFSKIALNLQVIEEGADVLLSTLPTPPPQQASPCT